MAQRGGIIAGDISDFVEKLLTIEPNLALLELLHKILQQVAFVVWDLQSTPGHGEYAGRMYG